MGFSLDVTFKRIHQLEHQTKRVASVKPTDQAAFRHCAVVSGHDLSRRCNERQKGWQCYRLIHVATAIVGRNSRR